MNLRARICLMGSALALSLIGSAGIAKAQTTADFTWTPYNYETSRVRALQAINDADLSKDQMASIIGLLYDLRDSERDSRLATAFSAEDLMAEHGTNYASHETRVNDIFRTYSDRRDRIWSLIRDRIGASKADTLKALVEWNPPAMQTSYYDDRIRRIDTLLTEWDALHGGTTVATTTVTTDISGRAHMSPAGMTFANVSPLTYSELAELMQAKLIAMTGSADVAWVWQGIHGGADSEDIKFARQRYMREWDWP